MKNTLLILAFLLIIISCREVNRFNGSVKIIKTTADTTLKDSALIFGHVFSAADNLPERNARIWPEGTKISSFTDSTGYFKMQVLPGTYNIKCKSEFSDDKWIETINNINLKANEKTEVEFNIGTIIE